jgi:hypothetical protein
MNGIMNKKVILTAILTVIALIVLTLFSFGPLAGKRARGKQNPESLQPQATEPVLTSNQKTQFSSYHNKDMKENFYSIKIPQDWQVSAGKSPGSYALGFKQGSGQVLLMDVPDNSTLELYILSQEEPRLKKVISGYQRIDYKKTSIQGNEAYQLTFQSDTVTMKQTLATYIAGTDQAGVIFLTANKQDTFDQLLTVFSAIVNSFAWENK